MSNSAVDSEAGTDPALHHLTSEQCFDLLRTQQIGRLGVIAEHYPLIFPVNYALDGDIIVIRTDPGTKLSHASHTNVTFEVDEIDQRARCGWSVLVKGQAEELTAGHRETLIERTKSAAAEPWAPGEHGHWIRLIPHAVSGRRLVPGELPPIYEPAAYL